MKKGKVMKSMTSLLCTGLIFVTALGPAAQAQTFERGTLGALGNVESESSSAVWADYDGDGDLDVFSTSPFYVNLLYRNNGDGSFTTVEEALGYFGNNYSSAWADLDNNGSPDLFVGSLGFEQRIFRNRTEGFSASGSIQASDVRDIDFADFDGDGDLDIALARRFGAPDLLIRNEGGFVFTVLNGALPGSTDDALSPVWGDYDNDGDPDLYMLNSTNGGSGLNVLYQNTGEGFVRVSGGPHVTTPGRWQSANWVDFDNDLDLDLFVSNFSGNNALYRNDEGEFVALSDNVVSNDGLSSLGSGWADVDNDGDQDLLLAVRNGAELLYVNDGTGNFTQRTLGGDDDGYSVAVAVSDYNDDGWLDVLVTNGGSNRAQQDQVYKNVSSGAGWLKVRPVGVLSNRSGIGAHIKVRAVINGEMRWQLREMQAKSGRFAQSGPWVHFGLGDAAIVDSVVVEWPSGITQAMGGVDINQTLTVEESGEAATVGDEVESAVPEPFGIREVYPNPTVRGGTLVISTDRSESVRVDVFDAAGRRVRTLLDRGVQPGRLQLEWDGRSSSGRAVAAGTYLVRMQAGERSDVTRVTLLR
jgi:hypothetical protein